MSNAEREISPEELRKARISVLEQLDKIDMKKCREDGERLERQIGIKSLTVKDWFQPFTI